MDRTKRRRDADAGNAITAWALAAGGAAAAEFALLLPLMLLILFAILSLGLALYNYEMLTGGIRVAVRQFAISRGSTTPWTDAKSAMQGSVQPALNWSTLNTSSNLQFSVNGTVCTSDAACAAALTAGANAQVFAQYPCTIVVMSINLSAGCMLSQTTQELVE